MIEVKNLKKTYHNSTGDFVAIKNVSFNLGEHGIVFLYGESGEGKSTLLNVLAGLDTYDDGKVLYNGQDIKSMKQSQRDAYRSQEIGLIFENDNLINTINVADNVALGKYIVGEKADYEQVEDALKSVRLGGLGKRKLSELSSGQLQRVVIARELLQNPNILFVDEPTGHLDKQNSKTFWNALKKHSKDRLVVAITHDRAIVDEYGDRVLEIVGGKIESDTYLNQELEAEDKELFENAKVEFKPQKRKQLHIKSAFKLGIRSNTRSLFRYISMMLFITFALVAFGTSFMLGSYNANDTIAKSAELEGLKYVTFTKADGNEISNTDIATAYNNGATSPYYKVYSADAEVAYYSSVPTDNGLDKVKGYVEVAQSSSSTNALGQTVLYGTYPSNTDPSYCVAISDYVAKLISKYGSFVKENYNESTTMLFKNLPISELVGKFVRIGNTWSQVKAIYQTNYEKYVSDETYLSNGDESFDYNWQSVYSYVHVASGAVEKLLGGASNATLKVQNTEFDDYYVATLTGNYNLLGSRTTVNNYEIVIPYTLFNELYDVNLTLAQAMNNDADIEAIMNNSKITVSTEYGFSRSYTIVGLSEDRICLSSLYGDGSLNELVIHANSPVLKVASKYNSVNELSQLITNFGTLNIKYYSKYSDVVEDIASKIQTVKPMFITSAVIISLFAVYFIGMYYADVITRDKKTVGVLRTMGSTSWEVSKIYLSASFLTTLITLITGFVFTLTAGLISNAVIKNTLALPVSIFHMTFGIFGWMFVLNVAMAIVGSVLPILIYCRKTPVEVVKR